MQDRSSKPFQAATTDATVLISAAAAGDREAAQRLLPLLYGQLRAIARQRMAAQNPGHTLQATALVHEAYIRLLGAGAGFADRAHFFRAAAEAMRHLLVDHARARGRIKRGGGARKVPLDMLDLAADADEEEIVALNAALERLGKADAEVAEVVRLRFFAGLSVEETAEVVGTSPSTVKRDWAFARAFLHRELRREV
jgi:RNA polymerase sigma factor (TIGR02999 family)